jgi:hypothetical protein
VGIGAVYCKYGPSPGLCAVKVECEGVCWDDLFLHCLPDAVGADLAVLACLYSDNIACCVGYGIP